MFENVAFSDVWITMVYDAIVTGDMTKNVTLNRDIMTKDVIDNVNMFDLFYKNNKSDLLYELKKIKIKIFLSRNLISKNILKN